MADEESPARISHRLLAINRSEVRINMKILEAKNICKSYDGVQIIDNFSLSLDAGDRLALLGVSGEGKTSLLNILLGISAYGGGEVLRDRQLHYLVVFQEDRLLPSFGAPENMDVYPYRFLKKEALDILTELGLDASPNKPAGEYSGGMKRRLAIARALYGCILLHTMKPGEPLLLVMDEPFKGLDSSLRERVIRYIAQVLSATGAALLLVTHDEKEATALGCGFIKLKK